MKEIKVKKINSLADVKYSQLKQFEEMIDFSEDQENKETFLNYKILQIFYGIKKADAKLLTIEQFELLISDLMLAIETHVSTIKNVLILDGKQYGLIPNFNKITAGELIDLDNLYREGDFIGVLSILFRPIIGEINKLGEYQIEPYNEYDDKFKDIDAATAISIKDFFLVSFLQLNQCILSSTQA